MSAPITNGGAGSSPCAPASGSSKGPGASISMCCLVFNNAETKPRSVVLHVSPDAVPHIMAWYGAYHAGDRYTVTVDGRNVHMDQNGEAVEWPLT